MQQLPCSCRRSGRRNCIEPSCPFESEVSKNELYFCPVARERNSRRTGEPELCPVELPAASFTSIVKTGRCTKHRKQIEENLVRQKRREEKEWERRREEEKEREKEEMERRKEKGLERIGEESPERVIEDCNEGEKDDGEGKGEVYGNGNGDGNGVGNEDEKEKAVEERTDKRKEKGDGLMPGMDANEMVHVKAMLERREARLKELKAEKAVDAMNETRVEVRKPEETRQVKGKGEEKDDENKTNRSQEQENLQKKEKETVVKQNLLTSPPALRSTQTEKDSLANEPLKKRDTGLDDSSLKEVEAATALLTQMVASDWEDDVKRSGAGVAEAWKVSGARKVSETRKMFEERMNLDVSSSSVTTATGASKKSGSVPLGQGERVSSVKLTPRLGSPRVVPGSYPPLARVPGIPPAHIIMAEDDVEVDKDGKRNYPRTRNGVSNPEHWYASGGSIARTGPSAGGAYEDVEDEDKKGKGKGKEGDELYDGGK